MIRFIFILLTISSLAQEYTLTNHIGKFGKASSFSYSPPGYFYISDTESNEIYKVDTFGTVQKYIGGYGWDQSSFDYPSDVFSTTLNVYVTDKNNHRIQIFDKDLNFLSEFSGKDNNINSSSYGYPLSCVVSNLGDIFILDSENKRILKFDLNGNYILDFGSYDSGNYSLSYPTELAISSDNKLFVLDKNKLIIFDQFGTGLNSINLNSEMNNLNITFDELIINAGRSIYHVPLKNDRAGIEQLKLTGLDDSAGFKDALLAGNVLYILTEKDILVFKRKG